MNYHLNRDGLDMGVLPLEELRRRHHAGELTGQELVWCPGMTHWQSLGEVLAKTFPGHVSAAKPAPAGKKSRVNLMVAACVVAALILFAVVAVFAISKSARVFRNVENQVTAAATPGGDSVTIASRPVVYDSNTMTAAGMTLKRRAFRLRQYVEGYKQYADHDNDCDARSLGLIQNWLAYNYGGTYDTNLPSLPVLSDKLAANPSCTDPLVLTVAGVNMVEAHAALATLERAGKGMEQSKYGGYPKLYATVSLAEHLRDDHPERVRALDQQALDDLRTALADGSIQSPDDQEDLGEILLTGWGDYFYWRNQEAVCSVVKGAGERFKWLSLVLAGQHEINEAWRIRGGGYANTVTDKGEQGFEEHLAVAHQYLEEAWGLQPSLPLAPNAMVYVSLGESGAAEMRTWFDRTTAAQIDFDGAWSNMRWGLRPRWYGNLDAMLALGVSALNSHRFDTDVPRKLFDSISDVEAELDTPVGTHIYSRDDIWPRLQEMYEGYIAQPTGDTNNRNGWRSTYATVAYLAGKYDVAREQLAAINWRPGTWNLTGWKRDMTLLPFEVAARTGSESNAVMAAEASREAGDIASALKQYNDLAVKGDLDDRARSFVRERLASLGMEKRLQTHEWVDFLPDTNFNGWYVERGGCTVRADRSLEVRSDENGHLLYSRARMGQDFEVRGQYEVQGTSTRAFQGGLVIGLPQFATYDWYAFRVKRNEYEGDVASFSVHWSKDQIARPVTLGGITNSFYLRFQNGKVSATVNDQVVFENATPPKKISVAGNEFLLGLGAFNDSNDTVIRYRGVQARLLGN